MPDIKLAQLPDRNPVRVAIMILPEQHQALQDYAALYAATYGKDETIADLIPAMLAGFLDSDRNFMRGRK